MSDHEHEDSSREVSEAKQEAADYVVERVESWQDGAEKDTVREELAEGMERAGVQVDDAQLEETAEQIHKQGRAETTPEAG